MKKSGDAVDDSGGDPPKHTKKNGKSSSDAIGNGNDSPQQQQQQQQQHGSDSDSSSLMEILRLTFGYWCFWIVIIGILYQICPGESEWLINRVPTPPDPPANICKLHRFPSGNAPSIELLGRLYLPQQKKQQSNDNDDDDDDAPTNPPIIILAHGLGLIQDANLQPYITAFVNAGFVAFTFDYTTFGYSGGWPRHVVNPESHVADLIAAIRYVKSLSEENEGGGASTNNNKNQQRIGLWGTSMGAGHVLRVAAEEDSSDLLSKGDIKAVVGQVPHIKSGFESLIKQIQRDPIHTMIALIKVLGGLFKWTISQLFLGETIYLPLAGIPGSAAMMQNPNDFEGYNQLVTEGSKTTKAGLWKNLYSVGHSLIPILLYRPYNQIVRGDQIQAPTLLIPAEFDTLCPAKDSQQVIQHIPNGKLLMMEKESHFTIYQGDTLQTVIKETVDFFQQHLMVKQEK